MNPWKASLLILGFILFVVSFVYASDQFLVILDSYQNNVTCEQGRYISKDGFASTIENVKALSDYCECYADKDDLAGARECYTIVADLCDKIFKKEPSDTTALDIKTDAEFKQCGLMGDIYKLPSGSGCNCVKNSSFDDILAGYEMVIRLNYSNAKAWNNRGTLLGKLCCIEDAKASFENAIKINSSLAEPWYNKGVCLFEKDPQEALWCFNKSIKLDPTLAEAWFNRCTLLLPPEINMSSNNNRHSYEEAVASYNRSIELDPDLRFYSPPYLIYKRIE